MVMLCAVHAKLLVVYRCAKFPGRFAQGRDTIGAGQYRRCTDIHHAATLTLTDFGAASGR